MACSEVSCSNRPSKKCGLQFFRFPLGDPHRLDQWLQNMRRENWTPSRNSRLCSVHFEPYHFSTDTRGRQCLKDSAVPTIFNFSQQRGEGSQSDDIDDPGLLSYGVDEEEGDDWLYEYPMDGLDDADTDKNDIRGGVLDQSGKTEDSPPVVNIKEEPTDEGYDSALLPQTSTKTIKQETDSHQEELRISSVYSGRGGESTFIPPPAPPPAPVPRPVAIFMSRRLSVLQPSAVATVPLRPVAPAPLPPPPQPPGPGSAVSCSGCSKVLLKGQTALQRKGSTQLFCSTVCLTGYLPPTSKARSCYQCLKEISQPEDMIMTPIDATNYMHFCSQFCLSVFNRKKKREVTQLEKNNNKEELRISSVYSVRGGESAFVPPPELQQDIREDESKGEECVESNEKDEGHIKEKDLSEAESDCGTEDSQTNSEQAKDGTIWSDISANGNRGRVHAANVTPEPTNHAKENISSALTSFLCLLDTEMLGSILRYTEAEAVRNNSSAFNLTMEELKAFIGLLFLQGITGGKSMSLEDYWSEDFGFPMFKETMSCQRFRDIMKYLRFDDKTTRASRLEEDKFAMISGILEQFVKNCISCYTPGPDITVGEQLFPTKARCQFTQYMANKPDKFGIKFWVAADVDSKYMLNIFPYLGKDESRPASQRLPDSVVLRLMEPFLDRGRNVTTDDCFTSLQLAKSLLARKTTIVGTIKKTRREIPPCAQAQSAERFSTKVMRAGKATLTIYQAKPKKNVCVLSTMHQSVSLDESTKKLPSSVSHYNSTKLGVDVMDQMARLYSVKGGSRRWPVAVFYNMLDLAGVNAHILYKQCLGRDCSRRLFLLELAKELCASQRAARATAVQLFTPAIPSRVKEMFAHTVRAAGATTAASQAGPVTPSPPAKRKRCQVRRCPGNKTADVCYSCGRFVCGRCCILLPTMCKDCSELERYLWEDVKDSSSV